MARVWQRYGYRDVVAPVVGGVVCPLYEGREPGLSWTDHELLLHHQVVNLLELGLISMKERRDKCTISGARQQQAWPRPAPVVSPGNHESTSPAPSCDTLQRRSLEPIQQTYCSDTHNL